jgi:hypothetical protein
MAIEKSPGARFGYRESENRIQGPISGLGHQSKDAIRYFPRTSHDGKLPPRGFGSLERSSRQRRTHPMAELTLISHKAVA